jgi:hypothetical protein
MHIQRPAGHSAPEFILKLANVVNSINGAFRQAVDILRDWQQRSLGSRAIGRLIEAVLGEQYATVTVSFPLPSGVERKHIPPLLLSTQPPRWCPI